MNGEEVVLIQAGRFANAMSADSRGYVLFETMMLDEKQEGLWKPISANGPLACEYLANMVDLQVATIRWIVQNCIEIKEGEQHMYYRFRTPGESNVNTVPVPQQSRRSFWNFFGRTRSAQGLS